MTLRGLPPPTFLQPVNQLYPRPKTLHNVGLWVGAFSRRPKMSEPTKFVGLDAPIIVWPYDPKTEES